MKLINSFVSKIRLVGAALLDKKMPILYEVIKDDLGKVAGLSENILIINDYSGYSDLRGKIFNKFKYICSRDTIRQAVSNVSADVIIVISCSDKDALEVHRLIEFYDPYCVALLLTNNVGQDIGAYAAALHYCDQKGVSAKHATLLNTSQFYDYKILKKFIETPIEEDAIVGLSYGVGPRFCFIKHTHIQSFAIKTDFDILVSIFGRIAKNLTFFNSKYRLIYFGEVGISRKAFKAGLVPFIFDGRIFQQIDVVISIFSYDHRIRIFQFNPYVMCEPSLKK